MPENKEQTRHHRLHPTTPWLLALAALTALTAAQPLAASNVGVGLSIGHHHGHRYVYPRVHLHGHLYYRPYGYYRPYYGYYGGYGRGHYGPPFRAVSGALDLNVRPKDAQIYINGDYVGVVRHFDGWPSYLWVAKGDYEVIFYREGYETVVRRFEVPPGAVIRVKERMSPGEATKPAALTRAATAPPTPALARRSPPARQIQPPPARPAPPAPGVIDARREPARIHLAVAPDDASVYLDGHFLGTGQEFGREAALLLDPGEHRLEVLRPGFADRKLAFSVKPNEQIDLDIRLEPGDG